MAGTIALPLQEFIGSLDNTSLPKVLQVCSGVYFQGLFKVVPEQKPYSSVEEMLSMRPVGLNDSLPFTFTSNSKMTFGSLTLAAGKALTVLSIERHKGEEDKVRCHVKGQTEASAEVCIPLSCQGEFYECESEDCYTLKEIMSSTRLRTRRFRFVKTTKCDRVLIFSPVHQVQAIMNCKFDPLCNQYLLH
ncbi:hypothetical protein GOODEAATRI_015216 [Goodea atripinnis]|uniref:CABIT domain-containing protein n=1 Tax=Goodea atripinnis TaxID=208336 RepID=A0ABV0PNS0_9TELE